MLFIACKRPTMVNTDLGMEPAIEVCKYDGSIQCESQGISLEVMEEELKREGIRVLGKRKGDDGRIYPAMCGGRNGSLNIYQILEKDVAKAENLGFKDLTMVRTSYQR